MNYLLSVFFSIMFMMAPKACMGKGRMFNIFWNTTSPMFMFSSKNNVMDINKGNLPWEYDQANIICPYYKRGTREADMEQYIIYSVSETEYNNCQILSPNPKVVAVCDRPNRMTFITITFRSFTPTPGGLEFHPGQDYYFISTSSRADLQRRIGGRCSTHNMKVMFRVAPAEHEQLPNQRPSNRPNSAKVNMPRTSLTSSTSHYPGGTVVDDFPYPVYQDISEIDSNSVEHEKRSEDYEEQQQPGHGQLHQAPVIQNSGISRTQNSINQILLVSIILLTFGYALPNNTG